MKILFTGASSFTGAHFVDALSAAGHEVVTTFTRGDVADYGSGVRGQRLSRLVKLSRPCFAVRFGDDKFRSLIGEFRPDLLCHHGADVTNYKSEDFDYTAALQNNTNNLPKVVDALSQVGCQRILLTGSVFEGGEGAGSDGLPHFSSYGLSKALTAMTFHRFCQHYGFSLGKFVIPNPFGPFEEPRFTAYLVRCWQAGEPAKVRTPDYVRDNIHVSLLAKHYRAFAEQLPEHPGFQKTNPSGYVEPQGAFAERFSKEMRARWGMECPVHCEMQTEFNEPKIRINTDPLDAARLGWREAEAWDEIAEFYEVNSIERAGTYQ